MSEQLVVFCKSFIYIKNSNGPGTEPRGTPRSLKRVSDCALLISTN